MTVSFSHLRWLQKASVRSTIRRFYTQNLHPFCSYPWYGAALNQDRTAINHNGLPGSESFLHQEQIGLRDFVSFADSANRETLADALV